MPDYKVVLPSKPKVVSENDNAGTYEIEGLYPGFGHTIGNSIRRIILSSIPGAAITSVKIAGVSHEFSSMDGVKEDVISILLNLKRLRFSLDSDEPITAKLIKKGTGTISSGDIELPGQAHIHNKDVHIATLTDKSLTFDMEMTIEKGLGYMPKESLHKDKVGIGVIALDATFSPIRRVHYEVENMRVGDRTNFNRLKIFIETDGVIPPREVLEHAIEILINQLRAVVGFKEEDLRMESSSSEGSDSASSEEATEDAGSADASKMKLEDAGFPPRIANALTKASIRTLAGLSRKTEEDLLELDGLGAKAVDEIRDVLKSHGLNLKD